MFASLRSASMQKAFVFVRNEIRGCGKWILKNRTLVGALGGSGMIIAHAQYGQKNMGKEIYDFRTEVNDFRTEVNDFRTEVNAKFSRVDRELAKLHGENRATQTLILTSAVKAMKVMGGDKQVMKEFIKNVENFLCREAGGEDCGSGKND
ncbi:unnamed protein product [Tuber aestivum]|uniref:Uncharacterized protein n=1 Tax=Tuber aestivum TaxID=59557 RepID=A0A292Q2T9_9PEZI|nr:unnamed protein product [Tuber aestivum]